VEKEKDANYAKRVAKPEAKRQTIRDQLCVVKLVSGRVEKVNDRRAQKKFRALNGGATVQGKLLTSTNSQEFQISREEGGRGNEALGRESPYKYLD